MTLEFDFYKLCAGCGTEKHASAFSKNRKRSDGVQSYCKQCHHDRYVANRDYVLARSTERRHGPGRPALLEAKRDHYWKNRESTLLAMRASKFGLTVAQLVALIGDGRCHICGRPESLEQRRHAIDHNHACCPGDKSCGKCVRGVLCLSCNTGLLPGYEALPPALRDSPQINRYLARTEGLSQ